ncbi:MULTISPECIES: ATP-dependent DNA helicase RecG [Halocynthiibacter]|uniref:ATP-dependent DNA helicase RecG n=1 Tax=Halocynthiibacter halioticoli TaxID=2986804 RepID=A0AAE3LUI8_9RHOB|nr:MULTISPECIES: ATP-dependent DNA helicase RecG [Halocynthiibacter]MCV6824325.1 ATP-dependent DNA helicase RecG [Halocynthiibacter halioticoli]MCW4057326.1 ATP-dependent DNA helicase RecG [Halocynthiibacter sp. SDUM655004]
MSSRPEVLFPLFADLQKLPGVGPKSASNFKQLQVEKPKDLLFLLPHSGIDRSLQETVKDALPNHTVTVVVETLSHQAPQRRGGPYRVFVRDKHCQFQLVFFHAHPDYLEKLLPVGKERVVSGKLEIFDGSPQISHPDLVVPTDKIEDIPKFEPVYPLTAGITQKLVRKAVGGAVESAVHLDEWIDPGLLSERGWPNWLSAIQKVHAPESQDDLSSETLDRLRLAYDELFAHQLTLALARQVSKKKTGISSRGTGALYEQVLRNFGFPPTQAQTRAIKEINEDLAAPLRMNRLLQGDVGAGKTLVALAAMLTIVEAGGQAVMMAPTEILARQHAEALGELLTGIDVQAELLTGRDRSTDRKNKLDRLKSGEIDILVGTHAVFQDDVEFSDLRLAVVDEQHRFGVAQRAKLGAKGAKSDVLVMTATPIPRSLALSQYGDLDVSILDEKPAGRKPVSTVMVSSGRLDEVVSKLKAAVAEGKQCYWVCPLVEESEVVDMTAAEERFKRLRADLGEDVVTLVHGQMPPAQKDAAMAEFVSGQKKVLVATTVIEVGVNVPSASIMVIERAESFGLAQLHQLRGRVGRGAEKSTCLLMYQPPLSETGRRRLEILRETEDGFKIAEEDLAIRGAGDMIGTAQSGLPRFRIANLERQAGLMETAQKDARNLLAKDPTLESPRGRAARVLLWLMEQDRAIGLLSIG